MSTPRFTLADDPTDQPAPALTACVGPAGSALAIRSAIRGDDHRWEILLRGVGVIASTPSQQYAVVLAELLERHAPLLEMVAKGGRR